MFYPYKNKNLIISALFVIILLIVGTFYDLKISLTLLNENNEYAILLAGFGQFPAYIAILWCAMIFNKLSRYHQGKKKVLYNVIKVVGFVVSIGFSIRDPYHYIGGNHGIALTIIGISLNYVCAFLLYLLVRDSKQEKLEKLVWTIFAIIVFSTLNIHGLKLVFHRPRMRMIIKENLDMFTNWFSISDNAIRTKLLAQGIGSDEFHSFPSGHSGASSLILLITMFGYCNDKVLKKGNIIYWICFIIWSIVALSRVVVGAHFVSDVTMGFLITFIWILICTKFILNKNK